MEANHSPQSAAVSVKMTGHLTRETSRMAAACLSFKERHGGEEAPKQVRACLTRELIISFLFPW